MMSMIEQANIIELTTTTNSGGTIALPSKVQAELGLRDGTRFTVTVEDGKVILQPRPVLTLKELQDLLASDEDVVAALLEDRRREKEREDQTW